LISISITARQTRWIQAGLLILLNALVPASPAFACGGIFDVACNLQHGGMSPGNIANQTKKAGQDVANAINELQASVLSGPALEQAIIASHNTAINGSMPIPPDIRQQLTGYASEDSMKRVRYKVRDNGFVNLARLLEQGGLASAVTLIDVIVFRGPSEAADPSIWAHELTHVDQYGAGAHSFAVRYARNWQSIENPAYAKGDGFLAWKQQNQVSSPGPAPWQQQAQAGFPSGFGMLVCGCYGNGPAIAAEPRCASRAVRINICPGFCPGGGSPYAYVCQ
jgi:hypothetical protein